MIDKTFSHIMFAEDPGMVIVTTAAEGEQAGCLVGFHCQAGVDPQRYCLWLSKANHTYRVAIRARRFAVHFLGVGDEELAVRFGTTSGSDKFVGLDLDHGPDDVPILTDLSHRIVVERLTMVDDGSDHVCVTTRRLSAYSSGDLDPLRLSGVRHLEPGHETEERVIDPGADPASREHNRPHPHG